MFTTRLKTMLQGDGTIPKCAKVAGSHLEALCPRLSMPTESYKRMKLLTLICEHECACLVTEAARDREEHSWTFLWCGADWRQRLLGCNWLVLRYALTSCKVFAGYFIRILFPRHDHHHERYTDYFGWKLDQIILWRWILFFVDFNMLSHLKLSPRL